MADSIGDRLKRIASQGTLQLTHIGRKSCKPYQVTIWFVVDGNLILLPTANINRNWVRNVRKTPQVELAIGSAKFSGSARFVESQDDRDRVLASVKRKYAIARPMLLLSRMLSVFGLAKSNFGAFEVTLSG
jgi:deazaflavin-dependent oxidoreductase (nitroreductase family)